MNNAEYITRALQGHWHGSYGTAMCPAHANTRTPALSLSNGVDGRLLFHCHAGCDFPTILSALNELGLIDSRGHDTRTSAGHHVLDETRSSRDDKRERLARMIWEQTLPIEATPAETYLHRRGITAPLPTTLRFHPDCWHGPCATRQPALVALIEGAARPAIHRTFLLPDGRGKAAVNPAKMMLGVTAGGAVRLADGQDALAVAEGIETALSLMCGPLYGSVAVWAALSTSGMAALRLPERPSRLIVATDGDAPGRKAGHDLAERASALGWSVAMFPAPDGRDWNDVLQSMKGIAG